MDRVTSLGRILVHYSCVHVADGSLEETCFWSVCVRMTAWELRYKDTVQ